jgi:hypothetical protein
VIPRTPAAFVPVFENTNGPSYIREAMLKGETVLDQVITVTAKGVCPIVPGEPAPYPSCIDKS